MFSAERPATSTSVVTCGGVRRLSQTGRRGGAGMGSGEDMSLGIGILRRGRDGKKPDGPGGGRGVAFGESGAGGRKTTKIRSNYLILNKL